MNRFVEAARRIPAGQTRTFTELAAMAARPGAARAAGRAIHACAVRSDAPWHRVTASDGGGSRDPDRRTEQVTRLRREGARPRGGETVRAWADRVGAPLVGRLPERVVRRAEDPEVDTWPDMRVEPLFSEVDARARGFVPPGGEPAHVRGPRRAGGRRPRAPRRSLESRLDRADWDSARHELDRRGAFHLPGVLHPWECRAVVDAADDPRRFERTVDMRPLGFGVGTYRYWREPPPAPLSVLRERLYAELREPATEWRRTWRRAAPAFPRTLAAYWRRCRAAGQRRGSSILLEYGPGGVNHPHRDLYGPEHFPFQALVCLSKRGRDFDGGELVLVEEDAGGREERRAFAVTEGDVVVFASRDRPVPPPDGRGRPRRIELRHGMDVVTRGWRDAAGIVFHLAR